MCGFLSATRLLPGVSLQENDLASVSGGRALQAQGAVSAKALRQEHVSGRQGGQSGWSRVSQQRRLGGVGGLVGRSRRAGQREHSACYSE